MNPKRVPAESCMILKVGDVFKCPGCEICQRSLNVEGIFSTSSIWGKYKRTGFIGQDCEQNQFILLVMGFSTYFGVLKLYLGALQLAL